MCNSSGRIFLSVNGVIEDMGIFTGTPSSGPSSPISIGRYNNQSLNGNIQALRITKGIARYTTNFNLPEAPFPIK
jgi:hypothetical protein